MSSGDAFQRDYLLRLPLPLAQLYSRAFNAKDTRSRHDNGFYLFEAMVKLACCPGIGFYVEGLRTHSVRRDPRVDAALRALALPSLGQWLAILRALTRYFEEEAKAAPTGSGPPPFAHMQAQVSRRRTREEAPAIVALYNRIANGPDEKPGTDSGCSLLQLFDRLVQYRNAVVGHGGPRFEDFYEREMGPLIFPAVNEVLAEKFFDVLGSAGARLVYLTEMRMINMDEFEVSYRELTGLQGQRTMPLEVTAQIAARIAPRAGEFQGLAVLLPGTEVPVRLSPMLRFRESEVADEILFLNRDRGGKQVEYLSYTTGRTERDVETAGALTALLTAVDLLEGGGPEAQEAAPEALTLDAEAQARPRGRIVGDCELLAEIGRGGMGEVWLARQFALGRLVALKQLPRAMAENARALARFNREVRVLGNCEHPNIIKLIGTGRSEDGSHYYTMEYVPGADLDEIFNALVEKEEKEGLLSAASLDDAVYRCALRRHGQLRERFQAVRKQWTRFLDMDALDEEEAVLPLPEPVRGAARERFASGVPVVREVAGVATASVGLIAGRLGLREENETYVRRVVRIIHEAALALDAVHEQGVVHRDVSPGNLMVTPGGRVVLMDFGLAKAGESGLSVSRDGGFLGKIRYAAPEQLASSVIEIGPPADVRALGVVMWELLTRRRLFAEATDERQLATFVHQKDPPLLRTVDRALDADLEAIVARATERELSRRTGSAAQLAEYLRMYLAGEPLPIRPPTTRELASRWLREHKPLMAATAMTLAAFMVFGALMVTKVVEERNKAEESAKKEEAAREKAEIAFTQADVARREAEQNLQLSRTTITELLKTITQSPVFKGKGIYGPQRELLNSLVEQLEAYRKERGTDEQLAKDLATARLTLCEAALALGELKEALKQGQEADQLFVGQNPEVVRYEQVRVRTLLAQIHLQKGEVDSGLQLLRRPPQISDLMEPLAVAEPDNPVYPEAEVAAYVCMARLLALQGAKSENPAKGKAALIEAVGWLDSAQSFLAGRSSSDLALVNRMAELYLEKAGLNRQLGERAKAAHGYQRVIDLLQPIQDNLEAPAPMRANLGVALRESACWHEGDPKLSAEKFDSARQDMQRAVSLLRSASEESPGVPQYQIELARAQIALVRLDLAQESPADPWQLSFAKAQIKSDLRDLWLMLQRSEKDALPGSRHEADLKGLSAEYDRLEAAMRAAYAQ